MMIGDIDAVIYGSSPRGDRHLIASPLMLGTGDEAAESPARLRMGLKT
jgi:hypothetical protein